MRRLFTLLAVLCTLQIVSAQSIPPQTCGILYTYDNAGNRIKQEYYCNNSTPRVATNQNDTLLSSKGAELVTSDNSSFQVVDALYPNPTTGVFFLTFSKTLQNAKIYLTDLNGRVVNQFKGNGTRISFDLSEQPSGVYFVRIEDAGVVISKKVIKAY
ncbi:T9SS type A sorting domain-containing protein [Foetidibacter luteolus]|uniref:T9SS type A sorting domain-containing protein n=1 Tax=Foetidibacter luteolus TaxID=2608880 RepID=UPI00129BA4C5|nr:T9SS type A sorting domain-containing protein [Foetidibacter luteolus]